MGHTSLMVSEIYAEFISMLTLVGFRSMGAGLRGHSDVSSASGVRGVVRNADGSFDICGNFNDALDNEQVLITELGGCVRWKNDRYRRMKNGTGGTGTAIFRHDFGTAMDPKIRTVVVGGPGIMSYFNEEFPNPDWIPFSEIEDNAIDSRTGTSRKNIIWWGGSVHDGPGGTQHTVQKSADNGATWSFQSPTEDAADIVTGFLDVPATPDVGVRQDRRFYCCQVSITDSVYVTVEGDESSWESVDAGRLTGIPHKMVYLPAHMGRPGLVVVVGPLLLDLVSTDAVALNLDTGKFEDLVLLPGFGEFFDVLHSTRLLYMLQFGGNFQNFPLLSRSTYLMSYNRALPPGDQFRQLFNHGVNSWILSLTDPSVIPVDPAT